MWCNGKFIPDYSMFSFSDEDIAEFNIAIKEELRTNREYKEYMSFFYTELHKVNYNTEHPF